MTFTITTTGTLSITAPTTTQHIDGDSTTNAGGIIGTAGTSNFNAVTVLDHRDDAASTWTATVSSTDFTTSGSTGNVIPADDATYVTNGVSKPTGENFTAADILDATQSITGGVTTYTPITLGAATTIVTETGYDGDNGATWSPTIIVAVPADALTGVYTGQVTHSVS